jgi:hypothetical protein
VPCVPLLRHHRGRGFEISALQATAVTLRQVLKGLNRRYCFGLSGWTFEHMQPQRPRTKRRSAWCAPCQSHLVRRLGAQPKPLISGLIGLQKLNAHGLTPIAIGVVGYRLIALCALAACSDVGAALAPLQLAVGGLVAAGLL